MSNLTNNPAINTETSSITREQVIALRREAKQAGDYAQADICGQALAGDEDSWRECERVISNAKAQA